ncbi:MAG: NAD(P)-binding domain-containing protein, partial [Aquaticitalea sp.]
DIINRIEEGSIMAYFNSKIMEIKEDEVLIKTSKGKIKLPNDFVVALTGYQPNFQFLKELGIDMSEDDLCKPFYNPETMETNVKGLYLAGVICGGLETHKWFIENSRIHAKIIADHLERSINKKI